MQASTRNAWGVLPLAFAMFLYAAYWVSQFDADATIIQWLSGIGAVLIAILALFQSVKGLMRDLTLDEKFPEEFHEFDEQRQAPKNLKKPDNISVPKLQKITRGNTARHNSIDNQVIGARHKPPAHQ